MTTINWTREFWRLLQRPLLLITMAVYVIMQHFLHMEMIERQRSLYVRTETLMDRIIYLEGEAYRIPTPQRPRGGTET